jgi:hypothetical protein
MKSEQFAVFATVATATIFTNASCGTDDGSCDVGSQRWSTAKSGGLCQVNIFSTPEKAMYCAKNAMGTYSCACGPVSASPPPLEFISPDMCDLEADARLCAAISACSF